MAAHSQTAVRFRTVGIAVGASLVFECAAWLLLSGTPIDVGYPPGTSRLLVYASGATVLLHYPAERLIEVLPPSRTLWFSILFVQGWVALFIIVTGVLMMVRFIRRSAAAPQISK